MSPQVETSSGHRLHVSPRRFTVQGARHEVVQVLSRWQEPESLGFTVLADDGLKYVLRYHQAQDLWTVDLARP